MRVLGLVLSTVLWIVCWLIAPASWWLNERILDERAFTATMQEVLEIEDVDAEITDRATAEVMDDARSFVDRTLPFLSDQTDLLLDRAEPTVSGLVNKAVNSQPGERAMLGAATRAHNVFLAWLHEDAVGRPGLQADLGAGEATFDLDTLLAGQSIPLGPVDVPLDALDLPGLSVPLPLPPDWMRLPLNLLRSAFVPALIGIGVSAGALVLLDMLRLRALAVASGLTALVCGGAALMIDAAWTLTGADAADWTITRALGELMVAPWITAYVGVVAGMLLLALVSLVWDRRLLVATRPSA